MAAAISMNSLALGVAVGELLTSARQRALYHKQASSVPAGRRRAGSSVAVNVNLGRFGGRNASARLEARIISLAGSFHTSDGGVSRNDAASTGPLVKPNPKILLEEAVRLQMDALARSDEPRPDHGLEVMYGFAITDGTESGGSLSKYFGSPSDLYHFGHFALKFKNRYAELINHTGFEFVKFETDDQDSKASVAVRVKSKNHKDSDWIFFMSKFSRGLQEPCWLTAGLQKCPA